MSPTHQDLSYDTTFSQIKSRVPVPLRMGGRGYTPLLFVLDDYGIRVSAS